MGIHTYSFSQLEALIQKRKRAEREVSPEALECRYDFEKFRKYVCDHDSPEHHRRWIDLLNTKEDSKCLRGVGGKHTLILSPRGSAKSSFTVEWAAWVIGVHTAPEHRIPFKVLYVSYSIEVAMSKSEQIQEILSSQKYQEVFPWIRPGKKWGQKVWDIDKIHAGLPTLGEPYTLSCAGMKGAVAGKRAHLCWRGETLIWSWIAGELHPRSIRIDELTRYTKVQVLTFNEQSRKTEWKRVEAFSERQVTELCQVQTDSGIELWGTPEHPVYTLEDGYKPAENLNVGQSVLTLEAGEEVARDSVSAVQVFTVDPTWVYDLQVEGNHNYFANGILVHNCIFDDLIKGPDQIENPTIRERMDNNWTNVIRPVMYEGARAVCLGTRMRTDDIFETTFTREREWEVIEESAIVEDENGEERSYWQEAHSLDHLRFLREDDPIAFALQYQNRIPEEGEGILHPDMWIEGTPPPLDEFDNICIGSDFSASVKEKADYTVFILFGKKGQEYWVLDMRRGRWGGNIDKCDVLLVMLIENGILETETEYSVDYRSGKVSWKLDNPNDIPVIRQTHLYATLFAESMSYQVSFQSDWINYVQNQLGLWSISCFPLGVKGDKTQRLRGITGVMQRGQVICNRYAKLKRLYQELFSSMGKDDCSDAFVLGLTGMGARPNLGMSA